MSSPPLSRFDLRKKISPKQKRRTRTRSRSRTPSYSPPPPPSHPSRMKSKSRKKVEEPTTRYSDHKAASEMRRPRSRSRSRTKRAKSGSQDRREKKTKKKRRTSADSSGGFNSFPPLNMQFCTSSAGRKRKPWTLLFSVCVVLCERFMIQAMVHNYSQLILGV